MKLEFINANDLKTLEHYLVALGTGLLSLKTLETFHLKALEIGILDEAEMQQVLYTVQSLRIIFQSYKKLMDTITERLPENISMQDIANEYLKNNIKAHPKKPKKPKK